MINLWFWTLIVAAPFGMAVYQQASEPSWRFPLVALAIAGLAVSYLVFGFPDEMFASQAAYDRHPDLMKFRAVTWVAAAATVCVLGALVGQVFRRRADAVRLGVYAFIAGIVGLHLIIQFGAST